MFVTPVNSSKRKRTEKMYSPIKHKTKKIKKIRRITKVRHVFSFSHTAYTEITLCLKRAGKERSPMNRKAENWKDKILEASEPCEAIIF